MAINGLNINEGGENPLIIDVSKVLDSVSGDVRLVTASILDAHQAEVANRQVQKRNSGEEMLADILANGRTVEGWNRIAKTSDELDRGFPKPTGIEKILEGDLNDIFSNGNDASLWGKAQ